jgi:hypothetical protein
MVKEPTTIMDLELSKGHKISQLFVRPRGDPFTGLAALPRSQSPTTNRDYYCAKDMLIQLGCYMSAGSAQLPLNWRERSLFNKHMSPAEVVSAAIAIKTGYFHFSGTPWAAALSLHLKLGFNWSNNRAPKDWDEYIAKLEPPVILSPADRILDKPAEEGSWRSLRPLAERWEIPYLENAVVREDIEVLKNAVVAGGVDDIARSQHATRWLCEHGATELFLRHGYQGLLLQEGCLKYMIRVGNRQELIKQGFSRLIRAHELERYGENKLEQ